MFTRCKNTQSSSVARNFVKKISSTQHDYNNAYSLQNIEKNELMNNLHTHNDASTLLFRLKGKTSLYLSPSYQSSSSKRTYHTEASSSDDTPSVAPLGPKKPNEEKSLFDSTHSAWEQVFKGLDDLPPLQPEAARPTFRASMTPLDNVTRNSRRQAMTAREISAFDDMFNMIFNAVSESKHKLGEPAVRKTDPLTSAGIGRSPEGTTNMNDLYGKLRRHSKRFKWTVEEDEELDRKKVEIEKCLTDHQLFEWAVKEVFEDSRKREEVARKAILEASGGKSFDTLPMLQSPSYPHLVTHLIMTFRERFRDPHLALSIFDFARRLSIASYVFGCTTPAYNQLIETRWKCFRDLKSVCDALEEMKINGVEPDNRTKVLVEAVRRELGERNFWLEENELDTGEVAQILNKMEALVARDLPDDFDAESAGKNPKRWNWASERWKLNSGKEQNNADDDWEFGRWDISSLEKPLRKSRASRIDAQKTRYQSASKMLFHNF